MNALGDLGRFPFLTNASNAVVNVYNIYRYIYIYIYVYICIYSVNFSVVLISRVEYLCER